MSKVPCAEWAERRSAFVDGALDQHDQERLLRHLASCGSCRRDVEELRTVRELIGRAPEPPSTAPADLSARLVSIAGAEADLPLWTRSLRCTGGASLPSARRAAKRRGAWAGLTLAAATAVIGATGYLAAPADLAAVTDPSAKAEAEFMAAVGRSPLHSDAMTALLLAEPSRLTTTGPAAAATAQWQSSAATGPTVSPAEAQRLLERAANATDQTSYTGDQVLAVHSSDQTATVRLRVVNTVGQGSQVTLSSVSGGAVLSDFSPAADSSPPLDSGLLSLLEHNYDLSGLRGSAVAGRPATVLDARRDGVLVRRWWVDDATGLVLGQDSFDSSGALQSSVGYTSVSVHRTGALIEHLPPRLVVATTNTALSLSTADSLRAAGWSCEQRLGPLTLVKLGGDRAADPQALHLTYSDGLTMVSVYEQRGRLSADPQTYVWDARLRAYLRRGSARLATWQSNDRIFTVMTDGSAADLAQAVAQLPHEPPAERTTMERIKAGWAQILADMRG